MGKQTIKKIESAYEISNINTASRAATKTSSIICELYLKVLEVQPTITGISTGMGSWSFDGYALGKYTEEGEELEECRIDGIDLREVISEGTPDHYSLLINDALIEIVKALDFLVDAGRLNCSTWQDGFNEKGVIFDYSETSNQNNPFSIPNKKYITGLPYYKQLMRKGVPVTLRINP
jgi:hypothetical protein